MSLIDVGFNAGIPYYLYKVSVWYSSVAGIFITWFINANALKSYWEVKLSVHLSYSVFTYALKLQNKKSGNMILGSLQVLKQIYLREKNIKTKHLA